MVNKTITVRFGKCTTLMVPKSWPMKAWLQDGDQWKAENLAGFCNWPITRCFVQSDRARLIIEHSTNFALSGNIDGPCNIALSGNIDGPCNIAGSIQNKCRYMSSITIDISYPLWGHVSMYEKVKSLPLKACPGTRNHTQTISNLHTNTLMSNLSCISQVIKLSGISCYLVSCYRRYKVAAQVGIMIPWLYCLVQLW